MKNYISLFSFLAANLVFGQVIFSDELTTTTDKLDPQIEIYMHTKNKNKAVILPYVSSDTSVADRKNGMFAYHNTKGCFVYYRDNFTSDCILDSKNDYALTSNYGLPSTVLSSTTWRNLNLLSANNTITLTSRTLVKIIVNSAHQYSQTGSSEQCAGAELGLFIGSATTPVKTIIHRTDATNLGNIFPVTLVYVDFLPAGTYTFNLKERLNPSSCTTNSDAMNWYQSTQMDIIYKSVN